MELKIVTLGVYGFDGAAFFRALLDAHVDTFCDLRLRRAMRGKTYAFANSQRLQQKLRELNIRYLHCKKLAPNSTLRAVQQQEDKELGVLKRARKVLGPGFRQAYEQECLALFDVRQFIETLGQESRVIALFCVEREPEACHRFLVAKRLAMEAELQVEHLMP